MKANKIDILHENVLRRLVEYYENQNIPAVIKGDEGEVETMYLALFDMGLDEEETLGECAFLPMLEDDTVQNFACMITITEDLSKDNLGTLFAAISQLNYYLAYGSFGTLPSDGRLVYKFTVPMDINLDENQLYNQTLLVTETAITMVNTYVDIIMNIANGKATIADLADRLGLA